MQAKTQVKAVAFASVPVGDWFKESADGAWYLKTAASRGICQYQGTKYEPSFKSDENVFVEAQ